MKKLKQLRESMNVTQQELAKALNTTQQTIARWESDKSQPDIAALKDLAVFFQTSVDDLLEYSKTGKHIRSSLYTIGKAESDGFWGHVGIKVADNPSVWFPVTASTADRLEAVLANIENVNEWVSFPTLANQYVSVHPSEVSSIRILDDAMDHPQDDWKLTYPYEGLSLELYKGFEDLAFVELTEEQMKKVVRLHTKKQSHSLTADESKFYNEVMKTLKKALRDNPSEQFIIILLSCFLEEKLTKRDRYEDCLHNVKAYYADGHVQKFADNADYAIENMDNLADEEPMLMLSFQSFEEDTVLVPSSKLAMITMPYISMLEKEKEMMEEMEKTK